MSLNDFKLRTKSLAPLAIMALTVLAMVGFGASRLTSVSSTASEIIEKRESASLRVSRAGRFVLLLPFAVDGAILNDDNTAPGQAAKRDFETAPATAQTLLKEAAGQLPDHAADLLKFADRVKALVEQAKPAFQLGSQTPGLDHGTSLKPDEIDAMARATKLAQALDTQARALISDMAAFNNKLQEANAEAAQNLRMQSQSAVMTLVILGALSALLAGAASFWITSATVERPLKRLGEQMRSLAGGDLSVDVEGRERRDEIGDMAKAVEVFKANAVERRRAEKQAADARASADAERERGATERARAAETQSAAMNALRDGLKRLADGNLLTRLDQGFASEFAEVRDDFNAAVSKLGSALSAVATTTGSISSSTREISTASSNLSQRTEQQAASLEETAAALEQITTTLKNSAQGAQHAAGVVATADSDAKKGAVIVRQAVEAMDAIAASSSKIGQIIGVIDEIAFQTNLLALNAGVEAARAGDSGRGFAVVASEVRALAQRSAEAAKEIKALVSASGAQVEVGVRLVAESGKALENIISQVSEINTVVAEIASGAQQQATGLAQINAAINQMDQSTQQNANMVEESTVASNSLSQEMNELSRLIEQFRVSDGGEERLRRDLKTVAPHAFARPAPAPAPARRAPAKPAPVPRPIPKAVAVGGGSADADWTEF